METARMIIKATAQSKPGFRPNHNNTEDLDDTLPVELLDCVETTTNEDWLTRHTPFHGLQNYVPPTFCERNRETFDPLVSATRYKSDGSSSEFSESSLTAECGSVPGDEVSEGNKNDYFISSLLPAASMEFRPLRCSTATIGNDLALTNNVETFKIRVDTDELVKVGQRSESIDFKPLRCSTGIADENVKSKAVKRLESIEFNPLRCSTGIVDENVKSRAVQRLESIEFKPLRCSTGLDCEEANVKPVNRPISPDEFYFSARNTFGGRESDINFVTALGGADCTERNIADRRSTESPAVQVTDSAADQPKTDVDNDLSILMECHLKIRNGRNLVSNLQAKPHIEFSVFKDSPVRTAGIPVTTESKPKSSDTETKIPNKTQPNQQNGINSKLTGGKVRLKLNEKEPTNFAASSIRKLPVVQTLNRGNASNFPDDRQSPDPGNRLQRAIDNLASSNIQRVILALPTLDSAKSASLCDTLVQQGLIDNLYDFLLKMNRSIAHQVACVHASSLLLDLAKYNYSTESVWQNGKRIDLLLNLMLIWVSKDNAIFLNCATIIWVFCQNNSRANVFRRFVTPQNRVLEKISGKLGTKIVRPTGKFPVPTLRPSWCDAKAHRAFQSPCVALSELSAALKQSLT